MGEGKRRERKLTPQEQAALRLTRQLADEGRIIAGGLAAHALLFVPAGTSQEHLDAVRFAYMAGAEHLFSSIMATLDPGHEPTDADMDRMDKIHREVMQWRAEMALRVRPADGHA